MGAGQPAPIFGVQMLKNSELAESVRRTAYFLWEHDGRPAGQSIAYWLRAKEMHQRQMAYDRWLAEGTPIGREVANWSEADQDLDDTETDP